MSSRITATIPYTQKSMPISIKMVCAIWTEQDIQLWAGCDIFSVSTYSIKTITMDLFVDVSNIMQWVSILYNGHWKSFANFAHIDSHINLALGIIRHFIVYNIQRSSN